ncbi:MAG TPA: prolipoprotein diacylglyceryl transferase [Candidatus Hydrogenedentes bacterium]|nr:prolipoprotein diacylglyceryl transferase [Candidatus Hydrogenedentota bacterium]HOL76249.1 prolipoprotein diacylglyceryl transferase [Candidatus Hydrogenedentota bacterium]HPO86788.1 prolipoprotein diacylglyceryl transferase [Candidatus Hydrogenedentota bacterium]
MRQTLFTVFGYAFHAYPVMISIAFVTCTLLAVREADKRRLFLPPEAGLFVFIGALIGARAFYIIQYERIRDVWLALFFWQAGLVFYGGLIGGTITAYLCARFYRLPPLRTADIVVPYLALGEAITRIGCFLNGCCFGMPTQMPWGVRFPAGSYPFWKQVLDKLIPENAPCSLPVHPTQLYMTLGLVLFAFPLLKASLKRTVFDGQTALLYGVLYGIVRFTVEIFRGESARSVFGMTVSQTISLVLLIFSGALILILYRWTTVEPRDAARQEGSSDPLPPNSEVEPNPPSSD